MKDAPVIGLGCQRSGTSATGHILAAPRRSGFQMENGIMRMALMWFGNALEDGTALSAARFTEFLRACLVRGEAHGARLKPAAAEAIGAYTGDGRLQRWIDTDDGIGFVRELCFDVLTRGEEVDYWGDKYPEHLFFTDQLRRVFPRATWVFVWREPASVIEALGRKLLPGGPQPVADWRFTLADCATQWVRWNRRWLDVRDQLPPERRVEVRFDDLVRDPPAQLARISETIGFDLVADRAAMHRAGGLRPDDLEKWRLSERAGEIEEQLARDDVQAVYAQLTAAPAAPVAAPRRGAPAPP